MHASDAFGNVCKDVDDLGFSEAMLQTGVHEINKSTAITVFHEQKDFVAATVQLGGMRIYVGDYGAVALEALHCLDFGAHASQALLVRDGNPLEDSEVGTVNRGRQLDEVDVCEAAFGEILLYHDAVTTNLNLGARSKGASRSAGAGTMAMTRQRGSARVGCVALLREGISLRHLVAV